MLFSVPDFILFDGRNGISIAKGESMPIINVEGPALKEVEKKRRLVEEMTDAAVKAFGLPRETIVVLLKENSPENVGVGGELVSDRD